MQSKKEFLAARKLEYKKIKKANKLAGRLEKQIAEIRAMGYSLTIFGSKVKISKKGY